MGGIMDYNANELKNVAMVNKPDLRKKTVIIPIADNKYQFKISGIGRMAIKMESYFNYSQIVKNVQNGIDDGLEYLIEQIIIDPNMNKVPMLDSSTELRERAFANKQALKRMSIESYVGTKNYEFRIAGIGGRAIKLEIYVGYEDIANELNNGNDITLEFILKELLVGNQVDYTIFEDVDIEDRIMDDSFEEEESIDEEIILEKLDPNESDKIISKIEGISKLIFDAIDGIDSDIFRVKDILEQDLIKSYEVRGQSFEPIVVKTLGEFIDLGIVSEGNNENYYKLW